MSLKYDFKESADAEKNLEEVITHYMLFDEMLDFMKDNPESIFARKAWNETSLSESYAAMCKIDGVDTVVIVSYGCIYRPGLMSIHATDWYEVV